MTPLQANIAEGREPLLVRAQRLLIGTVLCFVVLALFPFTARAAIDIKVLGYEVGAAAALVLWLLTPRRGLDALRRSSALLPAVGIFLALEFVAALASANVGYSLVRGFLSWAALSVLFLVAADVFHTPRHLWTLIGGICVAVAVSSAYGFVQYFGLDPFPWADTAGMLREAPSTFGNPNLASHVLMPATVLACGLIARPRGRWALLCLLLFLGHFALTRTRGSLLGLAAALLLVVLALALSRRTANPRRAVVLTFGVLLLIFAAGAVALSGLSYARTGFPYPYDKSESIGLRYHSFYDSSLMVQDKPLLGHGPGMYEALSPAYWTPLEQERFSTLNKVNDHVHNEPLEIAADAGLLAAVAYVSVLLLGVYYGLLLGLTPGQPGRRPLGLALAAFFLAFLIDGLFGFNVHVPVSATLMFVLAGATAGLWRERGEPLPRRAPRQGWPVLAARAAGFAFAAVLLVWATRDFAGQFYQQRGRGALDHEAHAAAAQAFRTAALLAPYDWRHPYLLGVAAQGMERPDLAETAFVRSLKLNPCYPIALFGLGRARFDLAAGSSGRPAEQALDGAVAVAQQAARLSPFSPEPYDTLGRAAYLRAQWLAAATENPDPAAAERAWAEAEAHLSKALELGSKDGSKLNQLIALARLARNDARGTQEALVRALEADPEDLETWGLFLQVSRRTGQYDALQYSLDARLQALAGAQTASADEAALLDLIRAEVLYAGYGDFAAAEEAFLRVVEAHPHRVDAWAGFHAYAKAASRREAFNEALRKAVSGPQREDLPPVVRAAAQGLDPDEPSVIAGVAALAEALQQYQSAGSDPARTAAEFAWAADLLAESAEAIELSPDNAGTVYFQLGLVYGAFQDFQTAADLLDRALSHLSGPQRAQCLLRKGMALDQLGRTADAIAAYEQAAAADPAGFEARHAYARALARDGHLERARSEYDRILTEFQLNEEARRLLEREVQSLHRPQTAGTL